MTLKQLFLQETWEHIQLALGYKIKYNTNSSLIHNNPKLETTLTVNNRRVCKYMEVEQHNGIIFSNNKEWLANRSNKVDESQKYCG